MMQFNTLIVHVVRLKELPVKGGRHLDAYASLNITGTDKWRSKVSTHPQRVDEIGSCQWDEHLEFQLNENYTDFQININHKSKLGSSETLASMILKLADMPQAQNARWYQLHKKGHQEKLDYGSKDGIGSSRKLRGMLLMSFEFKNVLGGMSISQMSLNTIGKENKLDKLKKRMNFGISRRKKAQMDAQSMMSVNLYDSRRSSICSNTSALAFSPAPSPVPVNHRSSPPQPDRVSLTVPPDPPPQTNLLKPPVNTMYREERRLSTMSDAISQCSNISVDPAKMSTPAKFAAKIRKKADKLLHSTSKRKNTEEFHGEVFNTPGPVSNSRPQSIGSSSGFASVVSSGNLDNLHDASSKEYLLQVIAQLRKELQLKEHRIHDLENYTGRLLAKIIDTHPDLLQVN